MPLHLTLLDEELVKSLVGLLPNQDAEIAVLHNPTATSAPGPSDDETAGYSFRSNWVDNSENPPKLYKCLDATAGAAVWVDATLTVDDLGSMALEDASDYLLLAGGTMTGDIDMDNNDLLNIGEIVGSSNLNFRSGAGATTFRYNTTVKLTWGASSGSMRNLSAGFAFQGTVGHVAVQSTAQSTSSTTGALRVTGGIGVGGNVHAGGRGHFQSAPDTAGLILEKEAGNGFQSIEFRDNGFAAWDFFQDRSTVGSTVIRGFGLYSLQLDHTFMYMNTTGDLFMTPWGIGGGVLRIDGQTVVDNGDVRFSNANGVIIESPNGTAYRIRVDDAGALATEVVI